MGGAGRAGLAGLLLVAACAPRVDPRSPFDEDDPRARSASGAAPTRVAEPSTVDDPVDSGPIAIPGTGARTGLVARVDLQPLLDAGPGPFLRWFDVEAESTGGNFGGWRLVRILPEGRVLTALDLMPGDVLLAVNGRALIKPADLSELWAELYSADRIVADLRRGDARFQLEFAIGGPPMPVPTQAPSRSPSPSPSP